MADLEQELREEIKNKRKEQAEEENNKEEPSADNEELQEEPQEDSTPETEPDKIEEEVDEEFEEVDTKSEEFKKLAPDAKKFYHMRKENNAKDKRIQEMAERLARVEGAQQVIQQPLEEKAPIEEIPDKDVDPDAYYDYQLKKEQGKREALEKRFDNFAARTTATEAEQLYKELENQHTEKDTSYKDAKSFLLKALHDEIKQENPAATESQISQHLKQQEYSLVATLASAGLSKNAIFNSIKAHAVDKGYVETKETPKTDKTKLKRNMEKSANLNEIPSASGDVGLTANQISKMSNLELANVSSDPEKLKKVNMAIKRARIKAMS